jgi:NAD(P)-dependent dehydrogenase (short-subunit alcohol dehydrogenase family)
MTDSNNSLTGKTIIVTGAASGIGAACVATLLARGANVCALDQNPILQLFSDDKNAPLLILRANVADASACDESVKQSVSKFGRIDGLIHMAATHSTTPWRELDGAEFDRTLSINVTGSFLMAQACASAMETSGGGAIVLASSGSISVSGLGGHGRGGPAYVASKAAIIGLTRALARSFAPLGVRVNAVSPGATRTAMTADYDDDALRKVGERTLVNRIGEPEEIASVACFLVSASSSYIVGETVSVNGGGSFGL